LRLHGVTGVEDYLSARDVSVRQPVFTAGLLLYALTFGKGHLARLDAWMARKVSPRRRAARAAF
jgi:hypothetical protein